MTLRVFILLAACAGLGACALAPEPQAQSWTDAMLAAEPSGEAPDCIRRAVVSEAERAAFDAAEADLAAQRAAVAPTGEALRGLEADPEPFADAARERARPPE